MTAVLFQFENVTNSRVKEINLTVDRNDRIVLFGPSGAGKSSLLLLFNRLQVPADGIINYKDQLIDTYEVTKLRKEIGLVLQEANLFPGTVLDNVRYGPALFGDWNEERAEELMKFVQLPVNYLSKQAVQLSGGEQQRINLARTLANEPDVLLLDEPTSALDNKTAEEIEKLLLKAASEQDKTLIMVTHNLKQAKRMGNKGIFMESGRVIESGNMEELLENPTSNELKEFLQENY